MSGADGDDGDGRGPTDGDREGDDDERAAWPVALSGVTETVVTTLGPNDRWNAAALGLFAGEPATARTWGRTRTRRNFEARGEGYVQFVDDPVAFVEAALSISEHDGPVLESAAAWARVTVEEVDAGREDGTEWREWTLVPVEADVRRETVPTIDRGFGAVIEATVAASRLGVAGYDESALRNRLAHLESVVERAGSPREREAMALVGRHSAWNSA
ncbi:DUF447 family protein [Halobacteria archaeon AArc-dxtr1]|nr:DUF447 family protein [Halobacteria archaeon AArc-dxtr1]